MFRNGSKRRSPTTQIASINSSSFSFVWRRFIVFVLIRWNRDFHGLQATWKGEIWLIGSLSNIIDCLPFSSLNLINNVSQAVTTFCTTCVSSRTWYLLDAALPRSFTSWHISKSEASVTRGISSVSPAFDVSAERASAFRDATVFDWCASRKIVTLCVLRRIG